MPPLEPLTKWANMPLFYIGASPVTLGGMASAAIIVVGSFFVSAVLQRAVGKNLEKRMKVAPGLAYAARRILHYVTVVLGVLLAIQCVGLNLGGLAVVFGFLSVGVGFGLQNVTSNFIAGIILLLERPINVGDFVSIGDQVGTVEHVKMRSTIIRTIDNITIIVPNAKFIENDVTNWSHGDTRVRIHCPVGVAYGSNVLKVKETLLEVAGAHSEVLKKPEPEVRFLEFGNSSLNFDLLVWIDRPQRQFLSRSQINYEIDTAFRKNGIRIPFPQRDLHLQVTPALEMLAKRSDG